MTTLFYTCLVICTLLVVPPLLYLLGKQLKRLQKISLSAFGIKLIRTYAKAGPIDLICFPAAFHVIALILLVPAVSYEYLGWSMTNCNMLAASMALLLPATVWLSILCAVFCRYLVNRWDRDTLPKATVKD